MVSSTPNRLSIYCFYLIFDGFYCFGDFRRKALRARGISIASNKLGSTLARSRPLHFTHLPLIFLPKSALAASMISMTRSKFDASHELVENIETNLCRLCRCFDRLFQLAKWLSLLRVITRSTHSRTAPAGGRLQEYFNIWSRGVTPSSEYHISPPRRGHPWVSFNTSNSVAK